MTELHATVLSLLLSATIVALWWEGRQRREKLAAEDAEIRLLELRRARLRLAEACAEGELLQKIAACKAAGVCFDWSKATQAELEANERLQLRTSGWPV
jgi:hypothetical protein